MKKIFLLMTVVICMIAFNTAGQVTATFTDSRDGKVYKTVTIGTQTWMAENLVYKASSGCWAYNSDESNVPQYGYLYDWETAKTVCPKGWHLPTDAEWTILTNYLGGDDFAGEKLKATSGWMYDENGTNESGFSSLPCGIRSPAGVFDFLGSRGTWWSSSEYTDNKAYAVYMRIGSKGNYRSGSEKSSGFSVRCVKD